MNEGGSRRTIFAALLMCVVASIGIVCSVKQLKATLKPVDALVPGPGAEEPRHEMAHEQGPLEGPMLQIEIPRSSAEFNAITPPASHPAWFDALLWDFLFIAGYVTLFFFLAFTPDRADTIWEVVAICGVVTGAADVVENVIALLLLYGRKGAAIGDTPLLVALAVAGTAKWVFFFLTCRALAIDLEKLKHWRIISVLLRAVSTAGTWAALLSLVGLPARPLLSLAFYSSGALVGFFAIRRIGGAVAGPDAPEAEFANDFGRREGDARSLARA